MKRPDRIAAYGVRIRRTLGLLLLVLLEMAWASDEGFQVAAVDLQVREGILVLDAQIRYQLTEAVREALDNGVPLTLEVRVQLRPRDAWFWEDSLVDRRLRYRIRYKPLSKDYFVRRIGSQDGRSYVTRDAALAALGQIKNLPLVSIDQLSEEEQPYQVRLRAFLDIETLPLPLRPKAYLFPSWKLSTGWTTWPVSLSAD